jgi:Xaa-Pro aminopeptidase
MAETGLDVTQRERGREHEAERPPQPLLEARLNAAKSRVAELGLDALIAHTPAHKGYLSGFTTGPFIAPGGMILITPPGLPNIYVTGGTDYEECRAALEPAGFLVHPYFYSKGQNVHTELARVVEHRGVPGRGASAAPAAAAAHAPVPSAASPCCCAPPAAAPASAQAGPLRRLGAEAKYTTFKQMDDLRAALGPLGATVEPVAEIVDPLREVKDAWEIQQIRRAVEISGYAFADVLEAVGSGVCEWSLAAKLEERMVSRGTGSARVAFQSLVVSGPRSALPHGTASRRHLAKGDFVTFDFGATCNGYCADVTRTLVIGEATPRHREMYAAIIAAKDAAIALMVPGRPRRDSADAAFEVIRRAGLDQYLAHGTGGHGIGLAVHEGPSTSSEGVWVPGNVCTMEPGIYIPGWGGVRVEDDVLITESGNEVLTRRIEQELLEILE